MRVLTISEPRRTHSNRSRMAVRELGENRRPATMRAVWLWTSNIKLAVSVHVGRQNRFQTRGVASQPTPHPHPHPHISLPFSSLWSFKKQTNIRVATETCFYATQHAGETERFSQIACQQRMRRCVCDDRLTTVVFGPHYDTYPFSFEAYIPLGNHWAPNGKHRCSNFLYVSLMRRKIDTFIFSPILQWDAQHK